MIRGEEFALEVTIFNYLKDATEVIYSRFCSSFTLQEEGAGIGLCSIRASKHVASFWEI